MAAPAPVLEKKKLPTTLSSRDMKLIVNVDGIERELVLASESLSSRCEFTIDSSNKKADIEEVEPGVYSILIGQRNFEATIEETAGGYSVSVKGRRFDIAVRDPRRSIVHSGAIEAQGRQEITSPMPGRVVKVLVQEGEPVEAQQGLLVVEAMKMQNEVKSPKSGKVAALHVKLGSSVGAGEALVVVE